MEQKENANADCLQRLVRPQFEIIEPVLRMRHDDCGGIDIMLDDFVYVHVNYDYRYTSNGARLHLANQIAALLRPNAEFRNAASGAPGLDGGVQ